jgi:hypothetical protein
VYAQVGIMLSLAIVNFLMLKFLVFGVFAFRKGQHNPSGQDG